jgi:hypothetical protein
MSKSNVAAILAFALFAGCADEEPLGPSADPAFSVSADPAAPTVNVTLPTGTLAFWPYTSASIGGPASDPINLVFANRDARAIRAALMFLDGNRTAFGMPNVPPFNCTWKEAVGGAQVSYAETAGWTASAIQLECGDYAPMRFHLRIFPVGALAIANAHFEVIVPGTNLHEVLSWELAEQLLTVDFMRSGLVQSLTPTQLINAAPTFRGINPLIYNGLPAGLRAIIGGPPVPVTSPVGIRNDGRATVISFAEPPASEHTVAKREFTIPFDQIIPKPFCAAGSFDYLLVKGSVLVEQTVRTTSSGNYLSSYHATGSIDLTPIHPVTREVLGDTYRAQVNDIYHNLITDQVTLTNNLSLQMMIPASGPFRGSMHASLRVGPGESSVTDLQVRCEP